jgi:hypothetical protein
MSDQTCDCCGSVSSSTTGTTTGSDPSAPSIAPDDDPTPTDRWLDERPATEATLPADLARAFGRALGTDPVETLGTFAAELRAATGGGPLAVEDLCRVDRETPHRAVLLDDGDEVGIDGVGDDAGDDDAESDGAGDASGADDAGGDTGSDGGRGADWSHYFRCFFDAVALAHLVGDLVAIRTESPTGDRIDVRATRDGIGASPESAVLSFGISADVDAPLDGSTPVPAAAYEAICPYVKAFPDRSAYERWAADVDAPTVGLPLAAGGPIVRALVDPTTDR